MVWSKKDEEKFVELIMNLSPSYSSKKRANFKLNQKINQEYAYKKTKFIKFIDNIKFYNKNFFNKKKSVLEIGCGLGGFQVNLFWSNLFDVIDAVELNKKYVEIADSRLKKYGFKSNIYNLPFEKFTSIKKYDIIIMNDVIEHVKDPKKVLTIANSLLNDNGIIYLNVINRYGFMDMHYLLPFINYMPRFFGSPLALLITRKNIKNNPDAQSLKDMHYYTKKEFYKLIKQAGFQNAINLNKRKFSNGILNNLYYNYYKSTWDYIVVK